MAGHGQVVGAVAHAGEHGRRVHRLNLHLDPHIRQVLLDQGGQAGPLAGAGQGEGLPIVSRLGQQFLGPFGVVGALPCRPGALRSRQDAGVGHRTQGTGVLLAQQFLVQGLLDGVAQVRAVHRLVVDHQFIEGAGHRPR